jgi:hypothetical protein
MTDKKEDKYLPVYNQKRNGKTGQGDLSEAVLILADQLLWDDIVFNVSQIGTESSRTTADDHVNESGESCVCVKTA